MSGLALSLCCGFDSIASFDGLCFFAAKVGADCVPVDGASFNEWIHITRGVFGQLVQEKESAVDFYLKWDQKRRRRVARALVLWEWRLTGRLDKEMTC